MNLYLILFLIFLGCFMYYYFFLWCQYDIGECRCDEEKMPYSGHLDGGIMLLYSLPNMRFILKFLCPTRASACASCCAQTLGGTGRP